ncbi:hypothetical protein V8G54_022181 [Vigna mungo]|uniref:Uncharacterized protein n=1 Tax=Vigna mungo TaxID=3915 RepID=A0AAQ3NEI3_VIGMU
MRWIMKVVGVLKGDIHLDSFQKREPLCQSLLKNPSSLPPTDKLPYPHKGHHVVVNRNCIYTFSFRYLERTYPETAIREQSNSGVTAETQRFRWPLLPNGGTVAECPSVNSDGPETVKTPSNNGSLHRNMTVGASSLSRRQSSPLPPSFVVQRPPANRSVSSTPASTVMAPLLLAFLPTRRRSSSRLFPSTIFASIPTDHLRVSSSASVLSPSAGLACFLIPPSYRCFLKGNLELLLTVDHGNLELKVKPLAREGKKAQSVVKGGFFKYNEIEKVVTNVLAEMDMKDNVESKLENWHLRDISTEEKRRLTIGIEILTQPRVMFLDERISSFDSVIYITIQNDLRRVQKWFEKISKTITNVVQGLP